MRRYKLKDDVDLKELGKFRFKKCRYYSANSNYYGRDRVYIDEVIRIIEIPTKSNRYDVEEYIQDLIEAGIVEKVVDG